MRYATLRISVPFALVAVCLDDLNLGFATQHARKQQSPDSVTRSWNRGHCICQRTEPAHDVNPLTSPWQPGMTASPSSYLLQPASCVQGQQFMPDLRGLHRRLAPESRIDLHVRN